MIKKESSVAGTTREIHFKAEARCRDTTEPELQSRKKILVFFCTRQLGTISLADPSSQSMNLSLPCIQKSSESNELKESN